MAKKQLHPADVADRAAIEKAVSFNVHLRVSPSSKVNAPTATLAEAIHKADEIGAARPGRRAVVYAILADGVSVPVPADMQAAAREPEQSEPAPEEPSRVLGKRAQIEAAARGGVLPPAPDFSAETHKRFRKKLAEIVALIEAGDIDGLKGIEIKPISSSPKAMERYRRLALFALKVRVSRAIS